MYRLTRARSEREASQGSTCSRPGQVHDVLPRPRRDDRPRRGAVGVEDQPRPRGEHGLGEVVLRERPAAVGGHALAHHRLGLGEAHELQPEHPGGRALGDVVDRRAEAAAGDDHVRPRQGQAVGVLEAAGVVAHDGLVMVGDAQGGQPPGDELRIRVEHLAHQEFGAHAEDLSDHRDSGLLCRGEDRRRRRSPDWIILRPGPDSCIGGRSRSRFRAKTRRLCGAPGGGVAGDHTSVTGRRFSSCGHPWPEGGSVLSVTYGRRGSSPRHTGWPGCDSC